MRHITRLPEPEILHRKHDEWQAKFDACRRNDASARPDSSKYGHKDIRKALEASSYGKCFYCEGRLGGIMKEIDHFVEVAIAPELAYTWTNLYLSCSNCNDKIDHNKIPVECVLDPCRDTDEEIRAHITFEDECICAQPGSQKGLSTIQKYRLNTELLDMKRQKWLNKIMKDVIEIQRRMITENRKHTTEEEKKQLMRYMQVDQPYRLMSEIYIKRYFGELIAD